MTTQTTPAKDIRIDSKTLHAFIRSIWQSAGSSEQEAALVADHLVMANLSGHDSHGVGMVPRYMRSLKGGTLRLNAHAKVVRDAGALLTIDGECGFGQVVAHEAMQHAITRTKQFGICAVGLHNAHHIGRVGHWAEQCAEEGLMSIHFANVAGDPLVAPFGGIDRRIGTNPFCAAFPRAGQSPLVLDFATSRIAYGKTRVAYNKGVPAPAGCLYDHDGNEVTDPGVMHDEPLGALRPFGDYKGYGLAAMCELFGAALTGGYTTHADTLQKTDQIINCMLSIVIDPGKFDAPDAQQQADQFIRWVKESRRLEDTEQIWMPGEVELNMRRQRSELGIPLDPTSWSQLVEAGQAVGVAPPVV
jgi:uncharacterized oxidoreductase